MKVLITGSTGFVGRYIVSSLKEKYKLILPVRNLTKARNILGEHKNILYRKFTENLYKTVLEVKPDAIINLLGILNESKDETFEKVHVRYVKELINGAIELGFIKFLHMSALGADENSKSRYAKTKALGEKYIMNSGVRYTIFRPSIILGKEQKLFSDLKKFKMLPLLVAPKGRVQPVNIYDVRDAFVSALEKNAKNKVYELCGPKIITYKELFEFALKYLGEKKPVVELPVSFFKFVLPFFSILPEPPFTKDQIYLLEKDNICSGRYKRVLELIDRIRDPFSF